MTQISKYLLLLLALTSFGCTPPHNSISDDESGAEEPPVDHAAMSMEDEFETIQYAIKAASCGELAFKFDPPLSRELVDSSFEAYVRYFGSLQKRLSRGGRQAGDQGLLFSEPRENAAAALGRQFGVTEARLLQVVRDQGGGDAIAAAREKFKNDGCSDL